MGQHYQLILRIRQWSHCKSLIPKVSQSATEVVEIFDKNVFSCLTKGLNVISKEKIVELSTIYEHEQFFQIHYHASFLSAPERQYWERLNRKVLEYAHDFEIYFRSRISAFYGMFPRTFAIFCTTKFDEKSSPPEQLSELLRKLSEKVQFFKENPLPSELYDRIYSKIPLTILTECTRVDEVFSSKELSEIDQIEQDYQATNSDPPSLAIYHTHCGKILEFMNRTKNLNAMKNFQQLIMAFTALDPYLEIKFDVLRVRTNFYIQALVKDNKGKILNAVVAHNFSEVTVLLQEVQLSVEDMKEVKQEIRKVLTECNERLHTQVTSLDPSLLSDQSFIPVWTELVILKDAAAMHSSLLPEFVEKHCEKTNVAVEGCRTKLLTSLDKFEEYFENNNFLEMEKLLTKFTRILSYKEKMVLCGEDFNVKLSTKFEELKSKLESYRISVIESFDEKFTPSKDDRTFQALSNLRNAPLIMFKTAASEYNSYDSHFNKLYGAVIRTVTAELKDSVGNDNIESFERKIVILESLSKCYGDCYLGELEQIVAKKKEELKSFKEDIKRKARAQALAKDIRSLVDTIKQYINTKQYSLAHNYQKELEANWLTSSYQQCMNDIQKGNTKLVLELLVQTWEDWYYYAKTLATEVNKILNPSGPTMIQWGIEMIVSVINDNFGETSSPACLSCGSCGKELYETSATYNQNICYSRTHNDVIRDYAFFAKLVAFHLVLQVREDIGIAAAPVTVAIPLKFLPSGSCRRYCKHVKDPKTIFSIFC